MRQDEIIEMARQISKTLDTSEEGYRLWTYEALQSFAKLVAEREREACAKLCDELQDIPATEPRHCAEDIRARK